ncbi:hypothetical protein E3P96_03489 [Wallemia ichthyophaga]|nr:hypothetical protein E3P96_03489 [Wallemia ichthyophaga]
MPSSKPFIFNSYSQRKIALKFSYSGWSYNGLAAQSVPTPLPTVEQTLWDALSKGRLVDASKSFDSAGWSRCGRTDKGVSSAGQVVALWVRSAYTPYNAPHAPHAIEAFKQPTAARPPSLSKAQHASIDSADESERDSVRERVYKEAHEAQIFKESQPQTHELNYIQILNSLLPPSIRILGWAPVHPAFDARFDCLRRHYKYYVDPAASPQGPGLDVGRMNTALQRLKGTHDFRNFCKVDASKQINNFHRTIHDAWIEREENLKLHCVNLVGSAFLYHQVRCMMAVLFLVGCGKEEVSVVDDLMRVELDPEHPHLPTVIGKPIYDMAHDLPLCLYDCVYDDSKVVWRSAPCGSESESLHSDQADQADQADAILHRTHIAKSLTDQLFDLELKSAMVRNALKHLHPTLTTPIGDRSNATPLGGNTFAMSKASRPLLERERGNTPDEINRRWRDSEKGKRRQGKKGGERVDGHVTDKMDISDADE